MEPDQEKEAHDQVKEKVVKDQENVKRGVNMDIIIGIICGLAMLGMLVFYNIGYKHGRNIGYIKGTIDTTKRIIEETNKIIKDAKKQKKTLKNKK